MNLRSQFYSKFADDRRIVDFVKLKCCSFCEKCNSIRTMKCSRITLFDRKEILQSKNCNHKHPCLYERTFQPQLENYLSWLNKPVFEDEQPYLTVCNIALPNNAMVFVDRGAQSDRWVHKRPRLRSAMQRKSAKKSQQGFVYEDEGEGRNSEEEKDSEIMEIQQVLQEYEIDENVQRLIQEAADYDRKVEEEQLSDGGGAAATNDPREEETYKRKHKKHKTKETRNNNTTTTNSHETKEKAKVRLNRTMTVSLSRPPSPETIQVIRVDVTSNYSMDDHRLPYTNAYEDDDDEDDDENENEQNSDEFYDASDEEFHQNEQQQTGNEKAHTEKLVGNNAIWCNRLPNRKTLMKIEGFNAELAVQCQKLALADRRSDVNVNVN